MEGMVDCGLDRMVIMVAHLSLVHRSCHHISGQNTRTAVTITHHLDTSKERTWTRTVDTDSNSDHSRTEQRWRRSCKLEDCAQAAVVVVTWLISIWVGNFRLVYINSSRIHSLSKQKDNEHASQVQSVCWRRSWSLLWATHAEVVILYQTGGNVVTYRLDMRRIRNVRLNIVHPEHLYTRICYHFPSIAETVEQWSNTIGMSREGRCRNWGSSSYHEIIYAQDWFSPYYWALSISRG